MSLNDLHFKIVVPFWNAAQWIEKCLGSIRSQVHSNFECIVIDDCSTDSPEPAIYRAIQDDPRFKRVRNSSNRGALQNIWDGFNELGVRSCPHDTICTVIDGDDWLSSDRSLRTVARYYERGDVWMTYGSFIHYSNGQKSEYVRPVPDDVIARGDYRTHPGAFLLTHLRTFQAHLWNRIRHEDLVDPSTGELWRVTWDMAMMFPMIEMAGPRNRCIQEALYIYNDANPLNDCKVHTIKQRNADTHIRRMPRYQRVPSDWWCDHTRHTTPDLSQEYDALVSAPVHKRSPTDAWLITRLNHRTYKTVLEVGQPLLTEWFCRETTLLVERDRRERSMDLVYVRYPQEAAEIFAAARVAKYEVVAACRSYPHNARDILDGLRHLGFGHVDWYPVAEDTVLCAQR